MEQIVTINKPEGMTPLEAIVEFKKNNPEYVDSVIGYAGRLDPMASGLLLLLIGEENKNRKLYERYTKEYDTDIVFGIATDSYDALGKITDTSEVGINEASLVEGLSLFVGKQEQAYPPYSSPRVNGKPLFYWAREGKLDEISIPKKQIEIYSLELKKLATIQKDELQTSIIEKIHKVKGTFRQEEIVKGWNDFFADTQMKSFQIATVKIACSSGTYVRSLAHHLGEKLGTHAFALRIHRAAVGKYTITSTM